VTSWSRRVSAAQHRPNATRTRPILARDEVLRDAVALGVGDDDQAALLALARVALDRAGFRATVVVHDRSGTAVPFEVCVDGDGHPVARPAGTDSGGSTAGAPTPGDQADEDRSGLAIDELLTDTLVASPDLVAVFASVGHEALWANDAFVTALPIHVSDKVWLVELLDEWSKGHYEVKVLPALVKYGRWKGRLSLLDGEGRPVPVSAVVVAHRDRRGDISAVSMVARDLAELRVAEERASATETRLAALVEHASDLIAVLRADGVVRYASPATTRLLGRPDADLEGVDLLPLVHVDDRPGSLLDLARTDDHGVASPVKLRLQAVDGTWRQLEVMVTDLLDNPAIEGLVLNAQDVTDRVEAARAVAASAFADRLTGLPNRMRFLDRLARVQQEAETGGAAVGVLLVDLDRYRSVNDAYGNQGGDALLAEIARRVDAVTGGEMVARLRSDEFAVLLEHLTEPDAAARLADDVRRAVAAPLAHGGHLVEVTASVGIAVARPWQAPEAVLGDADEALQRAKRAGRDRVAWFSPELAATIDHRRTVERTLRLALDQDGLIVHYQPIVDLATGAVVSAEALLRVSDDAGGVLSPAAFIEAAESSGLITRVGAQVLSSTCTQLAAWARSPGADRPAEVSVNVSPLQLADPAFPDRVAGLLEATALAPGALSLEVTETVLAGDGRVVEDGMAAVRALGVRLGLDEFGAGQTSLAYLKRFPLDFVKIDRSLVAGLGTDEQDTAIVRAAVDLAHVLGLMVVAVGVETERQLDVLHLLGCERAQGYLFGEPVAADRLGAVRAR
jgi:diguanylate cyclase (GGDEF)-like protein/PAS domain S-box-containing protein